MPQKKTNSVVTWTDGLLEIKTKKYIYIFEKKHLLRIFIFLMLVIWGAYFFLFASKEEFAEIVWLNGDLLQFDDHLKQWQTAEGRRFPIASPVKLLSRQEEKNNPEDKDKNKISEITGAVLRYSRSLTVTLAEGAAFKRVVGKEEEESLTLEGTQYLILSGTPESPVKPFTLNKLRLQSTGATIMHYVEDGESKIAVIDGELSILPQQYIFVRFPEGQSFTSGELKLADQQVIAWKSDYVSIEKATANVEKIRRDTYLPGFDKKGVYQPIGYATFDNGEYQLVRNGSTYLVREKTIPVMYGDRIINTSTDSITIKTESEDFLRLYTQSEIEMPVPSADRGKYPLLVIVYGQTKPQVAESVFGVGGRVRIKINDRLKRRLSFRSSVAMIGVKGTDFEVNIDAAVAETLVVNGKVSLSDPEQRKSIEITRGFMSTIGADGLPTDPVVIPADRFRELLQESFDSEDKPVLQQNGMDLNRLSIKKDNPIRFTWDKPIAKANIVISGKTYPLTVEQDTRITLLIRETLKDLVAGKYAARLEALDFNDNWGESGIQLSILPEKSLHFLCESVKRDFTEEEIEAIKAFQRETRIKVDGIIGPQTRGKIREMLNCKAN